MNVPLHIQLQALSAGESTATVSLIVLPVRINCQHTPFVRDLKIESDTNIFIQEALKTGRKA